MGLQCRGKADQDSLNFEGFKSGRSSISSKNWVEKKSLACLEMSNTNFVGKHFLFERRAGGVLS